MNIVNSDNNFSSSFFDVSIYYLHTAENILEEMINSDNLWIITSNRDNKKSLEDRSKKYDKLTKWSDFNVILPTLFLFYHGIETLFKSLIFLKDSNNNLTKKLQHNLKDLFDETRKNYPELSFMESLEKYLIYTNKTPLVLKGFISSNEIKNINELYFILRYPTNKSKRISYNYLELKYREKEGLLFIKELKDLIRNIRLQSVKEFRKDEK